MSKEVNKTTGQLDAVRGEWPMLRALIGGTGAMRRAGQSFLPQFPKEEGDAYKARLNSTVLYPAFRHTCEVMASKPFSRPPEIKVPGAIKELFPDIDRKGTPIEAFFLKLFNECLSCGLIGTLADHPPTGGIKTVEEEKKAGVRPYLATYPAESILGWREGNNGLELLRLKETVEEADGEFGVVNVDQVRVLRPGSWQVWRKQKDRDEWFVHDEGETSLNHIPFRFFYGMKLGFGVGRSPLLDLAYQNVEHWQSASDQQNILHIARVPVLFAKGWAAEDGDITVGAQDAVVTSNKDADLKYVEHTGKAVEAGKESLADLEDRMRATGALMLAKRSAPTQKTATEYVGEGENSKSLLQTIAEMFEESAKASLNDMAAYKKLDQNAEVKLYKDFSAFMDTDAQSLASAKSSGAISTQTQFEELRRRDIISTERTWQEEQKRIKADQDQKIAHEAAVAAAVAKTQASFSNP